MSSNNNKLLYLFGILLLLFEVASSQAVWTPEVGAGGPPVVRYYHTADIIGDEAMLLFGGVTFNGTNTFNLADTWTFDFPALAWKPLPAGLSPQPRGYHSSVSTSSAVYVIGGRNEQYFIFGDVWRFDLGSATWALDSAGGANAITARYFHSSVAIDSLIYVFGGYVASRQNIVNDLWAYDTTTKMWQEILPDGSPGAPPRRHGHSAVVVAEVDGSNSIVIFGGYIGANGMNDVWKFNLNSKAWSQVMPSGPLPPPRYGHSAVAAPLSAQTTRMVVFGGSFAAAPPTVQPYYNDVWSLDFAGSSATWQMLIADGVSTGPWRRSAHTSVLLPSTLEMHTFGGYAMFQGLKDDLWKLSGVWK